MISDARLAKIDKLLIRLIKQAEPADRPSDIGSMTTATAALLIHQDLMAILELLQGQEDARNAGLEAITSVGIPGWRNSS